MVDFDIENIIASALIADSLDLPRIAESIEGAEYNPDRFPGVVLRFESPRIVVLIFDKGRLMCTGGRSVEDVQTVMDNVYDTLKELDLLGPPPAEKTQAPPGDGTEEPSTDSQETTEADTDLSPHTDGEPGGSTDNQTGEDASPDERPET